MKYFTPLLLLCLSIFKGSVAQEKIVPLNGRPELGKKITELDLWKSSSAVDTVSLPFIDDFSEFFNKKFDSNFYWPNPERWTDRSAFVNDNLALDPMSVGVVTFDGVNHLGQPYNWLASNTAAPADTLTSVPLDLSTSNDVILSFYYQAGGYSTYEPEEGDSLVVELKDTADNWIHAWSTPGGVADGEFHRVMLPIAGGDLLYNGFQFRFRNYASVHTNGDFWHVDYIELDGGRSMNDTLTNDVALLGRGHSLLSEYSAIPWKHFKTDPSGLMGGNLYFRVRNGLNENQLVHHRFEVRDSNDDMVFGSAGPNSGTIFPLTACGNLLNDCNVNVDDFQNQISGTYSTNVELSYDSAYFTVSNLLDSLPDHRFNDTTVYVQEFYNYYAYDDGTAEVAFGLGNISQPGEVVVRYDIKLIDTLQALQIYFNPVKWDLTQEPFRIVIWSGVQEPTTLIYESPDIIPEYSIQNDYHHYLIDTLLTLEGSVFIGWKQQPNEDLTYTVGYDLHNDNSANRYYNIGQDWVQSSIPGSVMIRPVFGREYFYDPNSIEEQTIASISLYPNPVNDILNLSTGQFQTDDRITILDMTGRVVKYLPASDRFEVSDLHQGVYIIRIEDKVGTPRSLGRFVKQ